MDAYLVKAGDPIELVSVPSASEGAGASAVGDAAGAGTKSAGADLYPIDSVDP